MQKVVNTKHVSLCSHGGTYTDILPNYKTLSYVPVMRFCSEVFPAGIATIVLTVQLSKPCKTQFASKRA